MIEINLLIIDDSEFHIKVIIDLLKESKFYKFNIGKAKSLESALNKLEHEKFDIILSDLNLEDSMGLETAEKLIKKSDNTPIIVCTGEYAEEKISKKLFNIGVKDIVCKISLNKKLLLKSINYSLERKDLKNRIAISESKYEALFNLMSNGFAYHKMVYDENGNPKDYIFINLNKAFEKLTGLRKEELLGKSVLEVMPETEEYWIKYYGEVAKTGNTNSFQSFSRALNKHYNVYAFSPEKDYFAVIFDDVTDRVQEKETVERERDILKSINDTSPVGITVVNKKGEITFANKSAEKILGFNKQEIESKFYNSSEWKLTDEQGNDLPHDKLPFEIVKTTGKSVFNIIHGIEKKDGKRIILSVNGAPLFDSSGEFNGMVAVLSDVTEQKQNEKLRIELIEKLENALENERNSKQELKKSYEELATVQEELKETNIKLEKTLNEVKDASIYKTEFLANMSHEIRTPLTAILGFNRLMADDKNLTLEQKRNLDLINKSGERLQNLLIDILTVSQIEASKISINKKDISLEKLIEEIIDVYSLQLKHKDVVMEYYIGNINEIYTDEKRLTQILLNLVGNAIKFTNQGKICIKTKEDNSFYYFSIEDTGIGMDEEMSKHIFESFVTGERGYTKQYQGAGLGLTICKRLVELMGGKINVQSRLGEGSTFSFSLSKTRPDFDSQKDNIRNKPAANEKKPRNNDLKIAVVDDEDIVLEFIEQLIRDRTDYNAKFYLKSHDFLKDLNKNEEFDLVILDIRMPGINGIDCLKEIRKSNKKTPVIAMTAFAMVDDKSKFLNIGFDDYVSKPINIEEFSSKVNDILMMDN